MVSLIGLALAGGRATLSPTELPVDSKVTVVLTYTVGLEGMQAGDKVRVQDPHFHGMRWSKWGFLSSDPADCTPYSSTGAASGASLSVQASGDAELGWSRNLDGPSLHVDAWTEAEIVSGSLEEGDTLRFVFGDRSLGPDCGLQTSSRALEQVAWPVAENLDGGWVPLSPPRFDFVAGSEPVTLLVSAPSQVLAGDPFTVRVAAMDRRGNPVRDWEGVLSIEGEAELLGGGVLEKELVLDSPGIARLSVVGTDGLVGRSNPVRVTTAPPPRGVYFGDLHTHHGHSWSEGGTVRDANHEYARDVIGLQFGCETLKASPHELDWESLWPEFQQTCESYTDERYVAMLGFEWMGNDNSPGKEGHHNVYYDRCTGPLATNSTTGLTGRSDSLWTFMLEAEAVTGARSVSVPHAPAYTGFNWRDRDDALRPVAEIYSEWGDSSSMNEAGSSVYDGLALGNRMGILASSDNHDGWLGNRWAEKAAGGGLAAIVATDLSREGLFEALQERSTYATTGHRPLLDFSVQDGGEVRMGWEYVASQPTFLWSYSAEVDTLVVELLSVRVDAGARAVDRLGRWTPLTEDAAGELAWSWDGLDRAVWLVVEEPDGEKAWSSPIWLTRDCSRGARDPAGRCAGGDSAADSSDSPAMGSEPSEGRCEGCAAPGGAVTGLLGLLGLVGLRRRRSSAAC